MNNKIFAALIGTISVALICACSFTQEIKEGISFRGLDKFYIEKPICPIGIFDACGGREIIDTKLYKAIEECLKEKGMTRVSNKNEAQIIFVPLWNISEREIPTYNTPYNLNLPVQPLPIGGNPYKKAVSLEMQAWFPDMDSWVWRGFSPMEVSPLMMTSGSIRDQVDWCFKHFPPEEYPSNLEKRRDEIADKKYEEKNQFNNVLIEDRKNRDTISSERN